MVVDIHEADRTGSNTHCRTDNIIARAQTAKGEPGTAAALVYQRLVLQRLVDAGEVIIYE
jgi:hypothetical protein